MLLKNCRFIVTQNHLRQVFEYTDIKIEENLIKKIGKNLEKDLNEEVIDCSKKIVLPGLINSHAHLGMHSLKGKCDDKELFEWLSIVQPLEKKFNDEIVFQNTLNGLKESIFFGVTTVFDSYSEIAVKAFQELGVRGCVSPSSKTLTDSKIKLFKKKHQGKLLKAIVSPHAIYTESKKELQEINEFCKKHDLMKRIHVAETRKERFDIQEKFGKLPLEYLKEIGFLDSETILVHCIWITKGEIRLISRAGARVSHTPVSNMKLASGGVMPLTEMLEEKVLVGLGTDSVVSNNSLNLFQEMKFTALLHRHHKWNPNIFSAQKVLDMASIDSAKVLGLDKEIGSIEEGKKADLISLNLGANLLPISIDNLVSNLVYCNPENNLSEVIVDGKLKLRNREFV